MICRGQQSKHGVGLGTFTHGSCRLSVFFFQAEDGIRDLTVTGVQTCALPILFLEHLQAAFDQGKLRFFSSLERLRDSKAFAAYLSPLRQTEWVVYAKPPFGGPEQVLNYLGLYTHRVAISNNRLLNIDHGQVAFRWKDYRDHDQQKTLTLEAGEFIRRFLLHILPDGFQRIRHYGFLGHRY